MNPQLKKGVLEMCVLSQLKENDKYGYELTDNISKSMSIASGTLYPILKRLKDEGYVETYLKESSDGPARKYYHLTEAGLIEEKRQREEWETFVRQIHQIMEVSK
ncbi:MAG: PadR family transcriptional regulator [Traorella sp.]